MGMAAAALGSTSGIARQFQQTIWAAQTVGVWFKALAF